jgi:5-methyltetrahydrofolate--homocysteine methyltransferase
MLEADRLFFEGCEWTRVRDTVPSPPASDPITIPKPGDAMTRSEAFLALLHRGKTVLADGACGTMLQNNGLEIGRVPEAWLFERPDEICALHRAYVDAGSQLILTCSFGGTHYRLEGDGLADRVVEVNRRAARLAREVAGDNVFVAGDMGPTGQILAPLGTVTAAEVADAYAQQAAGLSEGDVDLLLIETMSDLGEARAAIDGTRRVTDLPVFCTFSFDTHGRTMMGVRPAQVAKEIGPLVDGIGANCGRDPAEYVGFLEAMSQASPGALLWAKPNAGLPHMEGDAVVYDATPEYMGQIAAKLREAGAQILGGCCGTTPDHMAAMAQSLQEQEDTLS